MNSDIKRLFRAWQKWGVVACFLLTACTPINQSNIDLSASAASSMRLTTPSVQTLIIPEGNNWQLSIDTLQNDALLDISLIDETGQIIAEARSISTDNRFLLQLPNITIATHARLRLIPTKDAPNLLISERNPYPDGQWGDNPQQDLVFRLSVALMPAQIWQQSVAAFFSDRVFAMLYCTILVAMLSVIITILFSGKRTEQQ